MPRSMQIFGFYVKWNNIKTKYEKSTKQIIIEGTNYNYKVKFSNLEKNMVSATITKTQDGTVIDSGVCYGYFPDNGYSVVVGSTDYRFYFIKGLLQLIKADVVEKHYEELDLSKEKSQELFENLKKTNSRNFVFNPRFTYGTSGYGNDNLGGEGFHITNNRCATARKSYQRRWDAAKISEPIFKLYKCSGIVESESKDAVLLKINKFVCFSMYKESTSVEWFLFYNQLCKNIKF